MLASVQVPIFILLESFFWTNFPRNDIFGPKQRKVNSAINFSLFQLVQMPNFISNRKLWLIWPYLLKKGKKNYRDIKEILFNKFAHPLHSLKMIFEKSAKFIITYFNTSVIINTIEMVTDTLIFFCRNQKKE